MACNDFPNNPVLDQVYDTGTQEYRWDGFKWVPSGEGSGGGGATEVTVAQIAHGFGTLDCIRWDGAAWVLAQANDPNTTALGVVVEVTDADNFKYAITGAYELETPHGLTIDQWYYLSEATPGGLDIDEPVISQPIVYIETATKFSIYAYRPAIEVVDDPIEAEQTPMMSVTTLVNVPFTDRQTAPLGTVVEEQNASEYFSADGTGITVLKNCLALVSYQFSIALVSAADTRTTTFHRIAINGVINQFSKQYTYHRNGDNPYGAVGAEVPIQLVAGDQITYEVAYLVTTSSAACQVLANSGNMTARVIDQEFTRGLQGLPGLDGVGSNPNLLINGGFQICQRSDAGIPTWNVGANEYGMDRWYKTSTEEHLRGTDIPDISRTGLPNAVSAYSLNARKSTQAYLTARQGVELQETGLPYPFKELGTYTMSGWFKCKLGEPLNLRGAWVDKVGSITNRVIDFEKVFAANPPLDEWFFATHTFTLSTVPAATNVAMEFNFSISNTATPDSIIKLHGIKIEAGDTATAFEQPKLADELATCQRYYYKSDPSVLHGFGYTQTGNSYFSKEHAMRATPTCTVTKGGTSLITSIDIHSAYPTHINFVCVLQTGNNGYVFYQYTAEAEL